MCQHNGRNFAAPLVAILQPPRCKETKNAKLHPPPLNELATWLVARSCLAAGAALPLFVVSALSGQTTPMGGIGASHLTAVVHSGNQVDAFAPVGCGGWWSPNP